MKGMILWAKLVLRSLTFEILAFREDVYSVAMTFPRELTLLCVHP